MPSSKVKLCSKHGYDNKWRKIAKRIRKRDFHLCKECLRNGQYEYGSQVDYIIPKVKGGTEGNNLLQVQNHASCTWKIVIDAVQVSL